jgi:hypothetical protein
MTNVGTYGCNVASLSYHRSLSSFNFGACVNPRILYGIAAPDFRFCMHDVDSEDVAGLRGQRYGE